MASPLFSVVVVCHLDMRQLILGGPDEFIFCVDSKKIFINQIATKIKNIGNDYAEQGVLRARIYTGNGLFIPINVPHDFVRKNDATWKERERGWRFYKIIPYHVSEEYKDAYEVSLSMLIDSIEETGFYEVQRPL